MFWTKLLPYPDPSQGFEDDLLILSIHCFPGYVNSLGGPTLFNVGIPN